MPTDSPHSTCHAPAKLQLARTVLVEEYPSSKYIYGRWDTIFGAWKSTAEGGFAEFVPSFTFETADPTQQYVDRGFWFGIPGQRVKLAEVLEDHRDLIEMDLLDEPDLEESSKEIDAYLALIPQRFKQTSAALGRFSWLGLEACWYFEEFSDWLLRSRWHARFANAVWYFADAKRKSRRERRLLHERIYKEKPLILLSTFMSESEARGCLSLLKRLNEGALHACDLDGLRVIMRSPQRIRALSYLPDLQVEYLRVFMDLPAWIARPAAIAGALKGGDATLEFLEYIQRYPNLLDETSQTWIAKRMETVRDPSGVEELNERWDRKVAAVTPFPDPPLIIPPPFEPIDTFEKLQQEGRQMNNCSAKYFAEILAGSAYFYHWSGAEPATVRLERSSAGQWRPAEMKGLGNADLSYDTVVGIRQILAHAQKSQ